MQPRETGATRREPPFVVGVTLTLFLAALTLSPIRTRADEPVRTGSEDASSPGVPAAVVVPRESPLTEISGLALRLAFLGEIVFLEELLRDPEDAPHQALGNPLHLCLSAEAEVRFLDTLLSRNYLQYRRYWADRILSGEPGRPPVRLHGPVKILDCMGESAACIGVVPWPPDSIWAQGVRPISVDGKLPGEPGYIFGKP